MNIDMKLEVAKEGAYEAVIWAASMSLWAAVDSARKSAESSARVAAWIATSSSCSASNSAYLVARSSESFNDERLKQLEMIKTIIL